MSMNWRKGWQDLVCWMISTGRQRYSDRDGPPGPASADLRHRTGHHKRSHTDRCRAAHQRPAYLGGRRCAGRYAQALEIASSEGQLVARNALSGKVIEINECIVPYLIGLTPPVAAVGLSEEEARDAGYTVGVYRQTYREACPAGMWSENRKAF